MGYINKSSTIIHVVFVLYFLFEWGSRLVEECYHRHPFFYYYVLLSAVMFSTVQLPVYTVCLMRTGLECDLSAP